MAHYHRWVPHHETPEVKTMDVYPEDENVCVDEVPCVWVLDDDDTTALQEAGVEVVEGGVLGLYAEWGFFALGCAGLVCWCVSFGKGQRKR